MGMECIPLWWLPFLLDLCEDTFRLVVLAVCARGHLAVAFDLLLPAHVASLHPVSMALCYSPIAACIYPCNAPPLGIASIVVVVHVVVGEHVAWWHLRSIVAAAAEETRRWRVHHGRPGPVEGVGSGIHGVLGASMSSVVDIVGQLGPRGYPGGSRCFVRAGVVGTMRRGSGGASSAQGDETLPRVTSTGT
jgi:hypothetical protein